MLFLPFLYFSIKRWRTRSWICLCLDIWYYRILLLHKTLQYKFRKNYHETLKLSELKRVKNQYLNLYISNTKLIMKIHWQIGVMISISSLFIQNSKKVIRHRNMHVRHLLTNASAQYFMFVRTHSSTSASCFRA